MKFKNVEKVRDVIARYAVVKGLYIHFIKSDHNRIRAEYKKGCPWVLLVSLHNADNTMTMKTYNAHHKCERRNKRKFCNSEFLKKYFKNRVSIQPNIKLREFRALVKMELKISVSDHVCSHVKKKNT